jgi:hypothetical protein
MKKVSHRSGYLIIPHFIRTITNEDMKIDLDQAFVRALKKLPSKTESILMRCEHYSDLSKLIMKEIEANIEYRIQKGKLSIKKPVKRSKERLFQIMGVVRRLKIQEMAKFKFSTNFGLQKDTVDYMLNKVFKQKLKDTQ